MLTRAQDALHWRLWGAVRKAKPDADRKGIYAAEKLPESHLEWTNQHFDKWKAACLAITQPENLTAQLDQARMAATRHRVFIGHVLAALAQDQDHLESILAQMNRYGRTGGRFGTYESLDARQLEKVIIAVKKEAKRRWSTKEALLSEILDFIVLVDQRAAKVAIMQALCTDSLPPLDRLEYEPLLVALGVLRHCPRRIPYTVTVPQPATA